MKQICLIGPVDKRPIAYPLIKCLMYLGRVLVVADESVYRRFSEDLETDYTHNNSEFHISATPNYKELKERGEAFDYVVYITTNELPEGNDKVIYCRGINKNICTTPVLKVLDDIEHIEVYLTFSKPTEEKALKVEPSKGVMTYINECEEQMEFVATKDAAYANMLQKFFEKELELPLKAIKGLLGRKE